MSIVFGIICLFLCAAPGITGKECPAGKDILGRDILCDCYERTRTMECSHKDMRHYPESNRHNLWVETILLGGNNITEFPTKQTFLGSPGLSPLCGPQHINDIGLSGSQPV